MTITERVKIADQVWIATALLHREHPGREWFTIADIRERVRQEFGRVQPGVLTHISQHCVADKAPNPGRYRMLHTAGRGRYRLYGPEDGCHRDREDGPTHPEKMSLPAKYRELVDWYEQDYSQQLAPDPYGAILKLAGTGHSGRSDISSRHHDYVTEAIWAEFHEPPDE